METEQNLFTNTFFDTEKRKKTLKKKICGKSHYRVHIASICYPEILDGIENIGPYNMPVIRQNDVIPKSTTTVAFDRIRRSENHDAIVVFYINDDRFAKRLTHPWDYTENLRNFDAVIGPDLSQYIDMEYPTRMSNCFWNKAFTAYWQNQGVNMYPNVTWSLPDSYEYSVAGLPKHSVIAINSVGVLKYHVSIALWLKGYRYVMNALEPTAVLRYGPKITGEDESISIYLSPTNKIEYGGKRE